MQSNSKTTLDTGIEEQISTLIFLHLTKNSEDWKSLQGREDDPTRFKHKAWIHLGGGLHNIHIKAFGDLL